MRAIQTLTFLAATTIPACEDPDSNNIDYESDAMQHLIDYRRDSRLDYSLDSSSIDSNTTKIISISSDDLNLDPLLDGMMIEVHQFDTMDLSLED